MPPLKRSVVVGAAGIPLGTIADPANRHDSRLLEATLEALVLVLVGAGS
jgi:hypothetical protein